MLMKKLFLLGLTWLTLPLMADSLVARYLIADSTQSLLNGAKVEFLRLNTVPLITGFDGLIRYAFPANVQEAQVMITCPRYDTLYTTFSRSDIGRQRMIMLARTPYQPGKNCGVEEDVVAYGYGAPMMHKMAARCDVAMPDAATSRAVTTEMAIVGEAEDVEMPVMGYAASAPVQAGQLTAGEVNDFAKWQLWDKILDHSHVQYISAWHMCVRERYRVQATTATRYPIADAAVELLDKKGHVLFAARTDNTGHAELWANWQTDVQQRPTAIRVTHGTEVQTQQQIQLFPAENIFVMDVPMPCSNPDPSPAPDNVDVFFLMDATGSMGDELRYMNAELQDVISRSQTAVDGVTIRTGALVYRDHGDEYLVRLSPLNDDVSVTSAFLNAQHASGGGDFEEAVPEALMAAVNAADWSSSARARIAFLILDAPAHNDTATLALLHRQIADAAAQGIRVVPVVCSGLREAGELLLRQMALLTNGTSFFLTDDSGIGETHLKPTTDSLKVEHLNDMLVRTIIEFSSMPECANDWADSALAETPEERFLPNPFEPSDLDSVPAVLPSLPLSEVLLVRPNPCDDYCLVDLPLGADALMVVDMTGKTLQVLGSQPRDTRSMTVQVGGYATGVYFLKAFYGGRWYTSKLIVR